MCIPAHLRMVRTARGSHRSFTIFSFPYSFRTCVLSNYLYIFCVMMSRPIKTFGYGHDIYKSAANYKKWGKCNRNQNRYLSGRGIHRRRLGAEFGGAGKNFRRTKSLNDFFKEKFPFSHWKFLMTFFSLLPVFMMSLLSEIWYIPYMALSWREKPLFKNKFFFVTPFLLSSYFHTLPITLLLEILGARMHWPYLLPQFLGVDHLPSPPNLCPYLRLNYTNLIMPNLPPLTLWQSYLSLPWTILWTIPMTWRNARE